MKTATLSGILSVIATSLLCGCATTSPSTTPKTANIAFNPACFKAAGWKDLRSGARLIYICEASQDTCNFSNTIMQLHFASANKSCASNKFTYDHGSITPQQQCAEAYFNESKDGSALDCIHTAS